MNIVTLTGRLTNDPEQRYIASGMAITTISIAVSKRKKGGEEKTSFFKCTAFDKTAENIKKFFQKGSRILVTGELDQNKWKDDKGMTRSEVKVLVNQFEFLDPKNSQPQGHNQPEELEGFDDDVPF